MKTREKKLSFGAEHCARAGKIAYSKRDAETMRNHRLSGRKDSWNPNARKRKMNQGRPDFLRIYPCGNHWHLTSTK